MPGRQYVLQGTAPFCKYSAGKPQAYNNFLEDYSLLLQLLAKNLTTTFNVSFYLEFLVFPFGCEVAWGLDILYVSTLTSFRIS